MHKVKPTIYVIISRLATDLLNYVERGIEALGPCRSPPISFSWRSPACLCPDRPPAESPHHAILAARHPKIVCEERLLQDLLDFVWIVVHILASLARALSDLDKHPPCKECEKVAGISSRRCSRSVNSAISPLARRSVGPILPSLIGCVKRVFLDSSSRTLECNYHHVCVCVH